MRPCGPLAPRDDKKTSSPLRFDRFVAVLNKHKIGVQERTESAHRSKRTGDFGAACEEEVELQLQAENHRPWRLQSQVWWPVQAGHAGVHIPRSAVQPFRLPGPMAAPTTTSAQECHAAFFSLKGLILLLMRCGWYGPSKYASVHMALISPQPAHYLHFQPPGAPAQHISASSHTFLSTRPVKEFCSPPEAHGPSMLS